MPHSKTLLTPIILISLFFVLSLNFYSYSFLFPGYSFYDAKRFLLLALLVLNKLSLVCFSELRTRWLQQWLAISTPIKVLIILFITFGAVSACINPTPYFSMLEVIWVVLLLVLTFSVASVADSRWLLLAINIGVFVSSVTLAVAFFESWWLNIKTLIIPGFMNVRFFSQYQIWTLPIVILPLLVWRDRSIVLKILWGTIAIFWWLLAIKAATKGLWLGLIMATFFVSSWAMLAKRQAGDNNLNYWLLTQLFILFFTGIAFIIWQYSTDYDVLARGLTNIHASIRGRLGLWHIAIAHIQAHSWFGIGPQHYPLFPSPNKIQPHNSVLQIASEWGVPAAIFALILFFNGIWQWFKTLNKTPLELSLTTTFLAGSFYSLVTGMIVFPLGQLMFAFSMGWLMQIYFSKQRQSIAVRRIHHGVFIVFLVGILTAILYLNQLSDYQLPAHKYM